MQNQFPHKKISKFTKSINDQNVSSKSSNEMRNSELQEKIKIFSVEFFMERHKKIKKLDPKMNWSRDNLLKTQKLEEELKL